MQDPMMMPEDPKKKKKANQKVDPMKVNKEKPVPPATQMFKDAMGQVGKKKKSC